MAKISVIVPVYNVAQYLRKCLDSLINQTLQDIEIILVDDGSNDGGGDICDEYSKKDVRVKVIHKANEGLSAARNIGIDLCTAQYIMFVDSDDWVEPQFCELPFDIAEKYNADLVLFSYRKLWKNGKVEDRKTCLHNGIISERDALYFNTCVSAASWLGLYRKSLFDTIRFPIGKYFEENATSHHLIHEAKNKCMVVTARQNRQNGAPSEQKLYT